MSIAANPMQIRNTWRPGSRSALQPFALVALIMVLLFATQSFNSLFSVSSDDALLKSGSVRSSPVYMAFVMVQAALVGWLFLHHLVFSAIAPRLPVGVGIAIFVLLSMFWSVDAKATLVPALILTYLILAAYVAAVYFDPSDFIRIFFWTTLFIMFASYAMLVVAPEYAIEARGEGGWLSDDQFRGIMTTKNRAGMVFATAVMLSFMTVSRAIPLFWRFLAVALGLFGVVLSNAATAIFVLLVIVSLGLWMKYIRVLRFQIAFLVSVLLLGLVLALPFIDFSQFQVFELFGRDGSLTGRDQLWRLALEYGAKKPGFGYGYYGFFSQGPYSPVWSFWDNFRWFITDTFHNSAADIFVSLGLTGVALLCVVCLGAATVVFNQSINDEDRSVLVLLLHVALIDSMTNFSIFFHNSLPTFIAFYAFFAAGVRYSPMPKRRLHR